MTANALQLKLFFAQFGVTGYFFHASRRMSAKWGHALLFLLLQRCGLSPGAAERDFGKRFTFALSELFSLELRV